MLQEDHARQATLHHFAGQRLGVNRHSAHPQQALDPALAEVVGSIEQRCVQLEDKADEVTSSLQVQDCFDLSPRNLSQPQLDCCCLQEGDRLSYFTYATSGLMPLHHSCKNRRLTKISVASANICQSDREVNMVHEGLQQSHVPAHASLLFLEACYWTMSSCAGANVT